MTAATPGRSCAACDSTGIITVPDGNVDSDSKRACTDPVHDDPFGGHEFEYESHTDLFRCCFCRRYEVVVRDLDTGIIALCSGEADDGRAEG